MNFDLKKLISKKISIITGISFFGLLLPKIVFAQPIQQAEAAKKIISLFIKGPLGSAAMDIGYSFLIATSQAILGFLNLLVKLAGLIFNAMLNIGFQNHLEVVRAGWGVTRDFANMFFILFLVVIAFSTILRFEKYGIKQLLPKIIIIALLINFSLVICSVIIDFTNITANFFIRELRDDLGDQPGGISGEFVDSLNLSGVYIPKACDDIEDPEDRQECVETEAGKFGSNIVNFFISMTMGSLVLLIAAFALFAGAILLLIRIVIIWFLLMFVPLVFLCYIMPGLRNMWQKWWNTFLRWCLFAPAYAFFVWLAVKVSVEGSTLI
ncbi:unnamed protein product, partial [marine sediment metagenome]